MARTKTDTGKIAITIEDTAYDAAHKIICAGFYTYDELHKIGSHLINYCFTEDEGAK